MKKSKVTITKYYTLILFVAVSIIFISFNYIHGTEIFWESSPTDNITTSDNPDKQDGREIKKLEWFAPAGVLPDTYTEYLQTHPLEDPIFTTITTDKRDRAANIYILVDATLHTQIDTNLLNQYVSDLVSEGNTVFVETISGGTPQSVKDWVIDRYNAGSEGFVFIGDITAAWAEVSGSQFPCDLFYMDIDGNWEDNNIDGVYETHTGGTGDMAADVYVGRLYASTLTYDTEANMINNYLTKVHNYRIGDLRQPWRGLEYVDDDWYNMPINLDSVYVDSVVRYDYGYYTTGADYLDRLDDGQHFVTVCAHGYSGGQHFATGPTESAVYANVYVKSPDARSAKLLLGSNDGIRTWLNGTLEYTNDRYGAWTEDEFTVDINLIEGWNQLLCKISQEGGDYLFSAQITDPSYVTFSDLEYQINDPDSYPADVKYIRDWLLNGFHQDLAINFPDYLDSNYLGVTESSINPDTGTVMGGKTWTEYNAGSPYVDMNAYDTQDYGVCYAFAVVNSATTQTCELWVGYENSARVWLNGTQVIYETMATDFEADVSKVSVTLNAGDNRLLVKVGQLFDSHGFSARFCQTDGDSVSGLTYDPTPTPITHIGNWLVNGPYANPDMGTRLTTDYLGGEETVKPSQDDPAPLSTWGLALNKCRPFDLTTYYDGEGDWVHSNAIQDRNPPAFFYNIFGCGSGRFTYGDYYAGAHIFNTENGLLAVSTTKSGGMRQFHDFAGPLSEDKPIGQAFLEWFQTQAPYEGWELDWYYGMVINGDPTLQLLHWIDTSVVVTNLDDNGIGSLRWAIEATNNDTLLKYIYFDVSGTIHLATPLPAITADSTRILGSTDPDSIIIDGSAKFAGSGLVVQSSNNYIEGLTITGFADNGIEVTGGTSINNTLTKNLIYENDLLGIDLGNDGVTVNDIDGTDDDSGPNNLQNYPVIDSVISTADKRPYDVYGTAADSAVIEFFVAHPVTDSVTIPQDPSGHGEAYQYIGSVTADENGDFVYEIGSDVRHFSIITATATDTLGNTSEFCPNFELLPRPLTIEVYGYLPDQSKGDTVDYLVDAQVTDSEGGYINKVTSTIDSATYVETGTSDLITIPNPVYGGYLIEIMAQQDIVYDTIPTYGISITIDGSLACMLVPSAEVPVYGGPPDSVYYYYEEGEHYANGDANGNEIYNILDITFLINYLYKDGPPPEPVLSGDANCDGTVNILDITYLIAYLYKGGPAPCNIVQ